MDEKWVREDAEFKADNKADHKILTLGLVELKQTQEKILTNHLPHIQQSLIDYKECTDENTEAIQGIWKNIRSLRKWLWSVLAISILILLESDRLPDLLKILEGFLP